MIQMIADVTLSDNGFQTTQTNQTDPSKRLIPHNSEPDYTRTEQLVITPQSREKIIQRLVLLYGETDAKACWQEMERLLKVYYAYKPLELIEAEKHPDPANRFTEKDLVLITYGDLLVGEERSPLQTLAKFLANAPKLSHIFNTLHLLPFFPYSSDRGFSITDFNTVDPHLGSWKDIEALGRQYQLMFDAVFNHISSKSHLFQQILDGHPDYQNFVTAYQSPDELTPEQRRLIVRPRTSDVLTEFQTINGPIWIWTTFSADQIDLNYKNPQVLLQVIEILLLYVRHSANIIRLDAVTYLWDEPGTTSVHLQQTHEIIKLFRDILDIVAPEVVLITETNVPHQENISYFGNGHDEAQMVYNFALPPLVLHTFYRGDARALSKWANELEYPSQTTNFFNILDSHDGVGVNGAKNILTEDDIQFILQKAREHGAFISYKTGKDGKDEPYEINTTWFSALNLDNSGETLTFQVKRFVASRSIALVLRGIPGIYFHGLIGTSNDIETVLSSHSKRDINRQAVDADSLHQELTHSQSRLSQINLQLGKILEIRVRQRAFHPNGDQKILDLSSQVFAILRTAPDCSEHILALTNVTDQVCELEIPTEKLKVKSRRLSCATPEDPYWYDLVNKRGWRAQNGAMKLVLQPYDVVWLIPFIELEFMIES